MRSAKDLQQKTTAFHSRTVADPHHRYRSWEHCYWFFRSRTREALLAEKDAAALQLGFYLASWGMYRGSSFLLQRAYTVHEGVIERLASRQFSELWHKEVGAEVSDTRFVEPILAAVAAVKEACAPFGVAIVQVHGGCGGRGSSRSGGSRLRVMTTSPPLFGSP